MFALLHSLTMFVIDFFKSPRRVEAENLFLRHQLSIALRRAPPRLRLRGSDRALLVWMTRRWPSLLGAAQVVQPETILRWHRAGFTAFWRWKSRKRAGRPKIDRELRDLIRRMSKENPRWGASRIHGELLMLGFEVAQSTVSKYMVQGRPPSQGWKTFLRNHAQAIAAINLCTGINRVSGGYVDDASAPRCAQIRNGLANKIGVAHEIDRNDLLPGIPPSHGERFIGANAGNIGQHVDSAKRFPRLGHDLACSLFLADIGDDRHYTGTGNRVLNM